jgi:hypothetical protein
VAGRVAKAYTLNLAGEEDSSADHMHPTRCCGGSHHVNMIAWGAGAHNRPEKPPPLPGFGNGLKLSLSDDKHQ